jgi:hypothetical protein
MRTSASPAASWVGPVVAFSLLSVASPARAADTLTVEQQSEITMVHGTVTITTTGDGRYTYLSMPPRVIGAPLSAAFVVTYARSTDSPIEFEGDAELIYDGRLLVVIPSLHSGWVFRLDLHPGVVEQAGGGPLLAVPSNVLSIEKRWWDRSDFPFPTTHEDFVKWHQQLLKNQARPSFPT